MFQDIAIVRMEPTNISILVLLAIYNASPVQLLILTALLAMQAAISATTNVCAVQDIISTDWLALLVILHVRRA